MEDFGGWVLRFEAIVNALGLLRLQMRSGTCYEAIGAAISKGSEAERIQVEGCQLCLEPTK